MKSKAKQIEMKILKLPLVEQESVREYFKAHPEKVWGQQKSLLKGFLDLPLFAATEKEKQQNVFDQ